MVVKIVQELLFLVFIAALFFVVVKLPRSHNARYLQRFYSSLLYEDTFMFRMSLWYMTLDDTLDQLCHTHKKRINDQAVVV